MPMPSSRNTSDSGFFTRNIQRQLWFPLKLLMRSGTLTSYKPNRIPVTVRPYLGRSFTTVRPTPTTRPPRTRRPSRPCWISTLRNSVHDQGKSGDKKRKPPVMENVARPPRTPTVVVALVTTLMIAMANAASVASVAAAIAMADPRAASATLPPLVNVVEPATRPPLVNVVVPATRRPP